MTPCVVSSCLLFNLTKCNYIKLVRNNYVLLSVYYSFLTTKLQLYTTCVSWPVVSFLEGICKENHIVFSLVFFIQCCTLIRAPLLDKTECDKTKLFSFCLDFHQMYKMFLLIYSRQSQGQDLRRVFQ